MTTNRQELNREISRFRALLKDKASTYPAHFVRSIQDRLTLCLIEGLIAHAKRFERLRKEADQSTGRRAYLALCTDLRAVANCFGAVSGLDERYDQLSFEFGAGNDSSGNRTDSTNQTQSASRAD